MNDEDEVRRMTTAEIGVLRAITRWRRGGRIDFFLWRGTGGIGYGYLSWDGPVVDRGVRASVTFSRAEPGRVGVTRNYRWQSYQWHEVASVSEAVDLLVALGFLPDEFSRAYRAGWDARAQATDADGCLDLITRPELAPVRGEAR